jgi:hypothetical protein
MSMELEQLGERIAEQAAHLDAAMHRFLTDLREFDERGGWHVQGARSCAHWLAWRVGWDLVTARERVRVAGKLAEFPTIDTRFAAARCRIRRSGPCCAWQRRRTRSCCSTMPGS